MRFSSLFLPVLAATGALASTDTCSIPLANLSPVAFYRIAGKAGICLTSGPYACPDPLLLAAGEMLIVEENFPLFVHCRERHFWCDQNAVLEPRMPSPTDCKERQCHCPVPPMGTRWAGTCNVNTVIDYNEEDQLEVLSDQGWVCSYQNHDGSEVVQVPAGGRIDGYQCVTNGIYGNYPIVFHSKRVRCHQVSCEVPDITGVTWTGAGCVPGQQVPATGTCTSAAADGYTCTGVGVHTCGQDGSFSPGAPECTQQQNNYWLWLLLFGGGHHH